VLNINKSLETNYKNKDYFAETKLKLCNSNSEEVYLCMHMYMHE